MKKRHIEKQSDINNLNWHVEKKDEIIKVIDNLYVRLRKTSTTYIIRKTVNRKAQVITLGRHPALKLRQAKAKAQQYLNADTSSVTVATLVEDYLNDVVYPDSKVPNQVEGYLRQINNRFGNLKVMDIKRVELVKFIKHYSKTRGPRSADRLRSYLKQLFAYGVELGYLIGESPMEGVTKRVTGYKPIDRDRTLTDDEIRLVWSWKNADQGWQKTEENARVIKFLLLTGLRISEAQNGYVDGDKFRIDDTKGKHPKHAKRPHWVFLTESAKALLPLPKSTATNIQAWLKRRLINDAVENRFTPHDCRRTFATLANDNGVEPFIVERVLNHRMQGVMATYNHAEYEQERMKCARVVETAIIEIIDQ
jgi:integrase